MSETPSIKEQFNESAAYLSRNQLGSIDLKDVPELKEGNKKDRNAKIANDYKVLKEIIENLIRAQTKFMVEQSANESQFGFGRGAINGLYLVLEEFNKFRGEHLEQTKGKEKFDKFKPI